jgi:hypothetical protein
MSQVAGSLESIKCDLSLVKAELKAARAEIKATRENMAKINHKLNVLQEVAATKLAETTDSDDEIGEPDFIKPVLPKTTIEDLNSFENMLQDAGYRKKLISCQIWIVLTLLYLLKSFFLHLQAKTIKFTTGRKDKITIANIMRIILSDEMLATFSWSGSISPAILMINPTTMPKEAVQSTSWNNQSNRFARQADSDQTISCSSWFL